MRFLSAVLMTLIATAVHSAQPEAYRTGQTVRYFNPGSWVHLTGPIVSKHGPMSVSKGKVGEHSTSFQLRQDDTVSYWRIDCATGVRTKIYSHSYFDEGHDGSELHTIDPLTGNWPIAFDPNDTAAVFIRNAVCKS